MPLSSGTYLGQFEVLSQIGSGGMGEVYRARDSRLSRDVALKILPDAMARDPERVARFEREARVLASLNHPHIASVHGFEQADGQRFLVLELVPGPTLADRLTSGRIPVREALQFARQIAEALEEAHAKGIIHRDLKPSNIKITPEGRVKVLDFGLAKALSGDPSQPPLEDSPTVVRSADSAGMILGTAGYMSPEQARGHVVDKRTDIWAFGCVLYEMLSGRRLFDGPSTTDVLAAVLTLEPDWSRLPPQTPPLVRSLLRRCLQKEKASRLHDIADARLEVDEALREEPTGVSSGAAFRSTSPGRRFLPLTLAFVLGGLFGAAAVYLTQRPTTTTGPAARFNINLPGESRLRNLLQGVLPVLLSADGTRIAYVGQRPDGRSQIFVRWINHLSPETVPGTEDAFMPFLSPDGDWLGFASEGKLKKVPLAGGQPVVICDARDPRGASWNEDGTILLAPDNAGGLFRAPASGGDLEPSSQPDLSRKEDGHRWPRFLPGGKTALFSVQPQSGRESQRTVEALNLETAERKTLVKGGSYPVYAGGFLFFGRNGQILAAPFDPGRLELTGEPQPVLDDVRMDPKNTGLAYFDVSPTGSAVYVAGFQTARERELVFMDRQGHASPLSVPKRAYFSPAASPDGRQIVVTIEGLDDTLWMVDIESGTMNRLTFDMDVTVAEWSPDGRFVFFLANAEGPYSLYRVAADGSGKVELVFSRAEWWINDMSPRPDGSGVLIAAQQPQGHDLFFVREGSQEAEPFLVTPSNERMPSFSPNGAFVAYVSNESGRFEVYVRPFPGPGPKRQVSTNGGARPLWSPDGREIFYWKGGEEARFMRASFDPGDEGRIGKAQELFVRPSPIYGVTILPDSERFVMVKPELEEEAPLQLVVIPGFLEETKARFAARHP